MTKPRPRVTPFGEADKARAEAERWLKYRLQKNLTKEAVNPPFAKCLIAWKVR